MCRLSNGKGCPGAKCDQAINLVEQMINPNISHGKKNQEKDQGKHTPKKDL